MSNHFEPYRQIVSPHDPDFTVHIATFEDLLRLQQEARDNRLNARWSSDDALRQQVEPDTTAVLCPLLRNGRHESQPYSYRCHLWFAQRSERPTRTVSLLDVTATSLAALPEVSNPDQLRRLIRMLLDGITLDAIW